jgi:hypothetical protein
MHRVGTTCTSPNQQTLVKTKQKAKRVSRKVKHRETHQKLLSVLDQYKNFKNKCSNKYLVVEKCYDAPMTDAR